MLLTEIKNIKSKGTYAGMRFSKETIANVNKLCEKFDIINKVPNNEFHTTLLFSTKNLPNYEPLGKLDEPLIGQPTKFMMWDTQRDNPKQALVLKFKCEELSKRHRDLMDEHKATWSFPTFMPHLTLSYDIGKFELENINKYIQENPFDIIMDTEYHEDLKIKENFTIGDIL